MELEDKKIKNCINEFVTKGYVIRDIQNINSLNWINKEYKKIIKQFLPVKNINDDQQIFNQIHTYVKLKDLNKFRLSVFNEINKKKFFKHHYYNIAKEYLDILAGNELAIQSRINLSIQIPNDKSSLLPLHADTWSGVSPYEIVVWLPLVDCYQTKSMYFYDITKMKYFNKVFKNKNFSTSKIFNHFPRSKINKNIDVALWGLSFKPDTADIRESIGIKIALSLSKHFQNIRVHDPLAIKNSKTVLKRIQNIKYFGNKYQSISSATRLLIVCTEWDEYKALDISKLRNVKYVFDGRNIYHHSTFTNNIKLIGIGKKVEAEAGIEPA